MKMSEIYNGSQWAHDIFLVNKAGAMEYITGRSSTLLMIFFFPFTVQCTGNPGLGGFGKFCHSIHVGKFFFILIHESISIICRHSGCCII